MALQHVILCPLLSVLQHTALSGVIAQEGLTHLCSHLNRNCSLHEILFFVAPFILNILCFRSNHSMLLKDAFLEVQQTSIMFMCLY